MTELGTIENEIVIPGFQELRVPEKPAKLIIEDYIYVFGYETGTSIIPKVFVPEVLTPFVHVPRKPINLYEVIKTMRESVRSPKGFNISLPSLHEVITLTKSGFFKNLPHNNTQILTGDRHPPDSAHTDNHISVVVNPGAQSDEFNVSIGRIAASGIAFPYIALPIIHPK